MAKMGILSQIKKWISYFTQKRKIALAFNGQMENQHKV